MQGPARVIFLPVWRVALKNFLIINPLSPMHWFRLFSLRKVRAAAVLNPLNRVSHEFPSSVKGWTVLGLLVSPSKEGKPAVTYVEHWSDMDR